MKARMMNPLMSVPGALEVLQALGKAGAEGSLSRKTILLVQYYTVSCRLKHPDEGGNQ